MKPSTGRMMLATASVAVREAAQRCMGSFRADRAGSAMLLREGDTRFAVVRNGRLLVESAGHHPLARGVRAAGARHAPGRCLGGQVPAPQPVIDAVRVAFR